MTISIAKTNDTRSIFSHWAWVVPVLLFVSSITLYQTDLVPPSFDEWATMSTTAFVDWENPASFLQLHTRGHPSHMPGFYILLAAWSKLTSPDIAILRCLGVLLSILHMALVYRLANVFVAPVAGLFAVIIVVSNAFFNFYIALARPYTLFVLLSCLTTWHYLRMVHRRNVPRNRDLASLGAAVFALVMDASLFRHLTVFAWTLSSDLCAKRPPLAEGWASRCDTYCALPADSRVRLVRLQHFNQPPAE